MARSSLAPALLLSMPDLGDPNFRRTVVLLVHHDENGTIGLVLNRRTEIQVGELCETLGMEWRGDPERPVHWGGPVQPNTGWVVTADAVLEGVPEATRFGEGLHFAGSLEALQRVAEVAPRNMRLFLGYSGWAGGQLEDELTRGAWVVAPFSLGAVFDVEEDALWEHVWSLLGIDPATVVSTPGVH